MKYIIFIHTHTHLYIIYYSVLYSLDVIMCIGKKTAGDVILLPCIYGVVRREGRPRHVKRAVLVLTWTIFIGCVRTPGVYAAAVIGHRDFYKVNVLLLFTVWRFSIPPPPPLSINVCAVNKYNIKLMYYYVCDANTLHRGSVYSSAVIKIT